MLFIAFLIQFLFATTANAEIYYVAPPQCPANTSPHSQTIAQVNPALLPRYAIKQGITRTCGIHTGMVLLNSLHRLNQFQAKGFSTHTIDDLSFIDGMFRYGHIDSEQTCTLPFVENPIPFLIKAARKHVGQLDKMGMTIQEALKISDRYRTKKKIQSIDPELLQNTIKPLLEQSMMTSAERVISRVPLMRKFYQKMNSSEVPLPPFQIEPWDRFDSEQELLEQLILNFKNQTPVLPLALTTCGQSRGGDCNPGHAVTLTEVTQTYCKDRDGEIKKTIYTATLLNSDGSNGPFDLALLIRGMFQFHYGFAKVVPCPTIEEKGGVGCSQSLIKSHPKGLSTFHYANAGDLDGLLQSVSSGSDPDEISPYEYRPLYVAAEYGHTNVVRALVKILSMDAINATYSNGASALFVAAQNGHTEVVKILSSLPGSHINLAIPLDGATPLLIAIQGNHFETVQALLSAENIDVNLAAKEGFTPLILASMRGQLKIVEALLNTPKIQLDLKYNGKTALDWARLRLHSKIVQRLQEFDSSSKGL